VIEVDTENETVKVKWVKTNEEESIPMKNALPNSRKSLEQCGVGEGNKI
jgi:hypothetical protein